MANPKGIRGSWFANWKGESLPCVHERWFEGGRGRHYADPMVTDNPKWDPFIRAIQDGGVVILTKDELDASRIPTRRTGYIASYRVENVSVENATLEFDITERLDDFT